MLARRSEAFPQGQAPPDSLIKKQRLGTGNHLLTLLEGKNITGFKSCGLFMNLNLIVDVSVLINPVPVFQAPGGHPEV